MICWQFFPMISLFHINYLSPPRFWLFSYPSAMPSQLLFLIVLVSADYITKGYPSSDWFWNLSRNHRFGVNPMVPTCSNRKCCNPSRKLKPPSNPQFRWFRQLPCVDPPLTASLRAAAGAKKWDMNSNKHGRLPLKTNTLHWTRDGLWKMCFLIGSMAPFSCGFRPLVGQAV